MKLTRNNEANALITGPKRLKGNIRAKNNSENMNIIDITIKKTAFAFIKDTISLYG